MSDKSILVVDDDPSIVQMTTLLLRQAGYTVRSARSGEEALLAVRDEAMPHLILLDVTMPGMDGWEVLRLLKSDEATAPVPVVMFSVRYEIRDKVHAMQQGAYDYITKPFSTEDLLVRVERILADAGAA